MSDRDWREDVWAALKAARVGVVAYVPDAGHARAIAAAAADPEVHAVPCTTEEEGVAIAAGAHLGGKRAALLMQSSGVGNCVNMLSLIATCRFPLLALVTMRGEWAEFNPWQNPMSRGTEPALTTMGVDCWRVDRSGEVAETVAAAADHVFNGEQAVAVLLGQRLIGRKEWVK